MRAVPIFCVIIAAAVACPLLDKKDCSCNLPKICPSTWNIKKFESQYATLAFQGTWYLQMATPTMIDEQNPLKTGLFCNSYPCTDNQLIFKDTTPCDDTDFNTEYEMTDSSYNLYTQCTEIQKALLCPAYGKDSEYGLFNVGCEKYYVNAIIEKYPFIDKDLYRHKIGKRNCEREYTLAVIGADDCWKEYMVLAVINQYDNFFGGNDYLIWVVTRDANPDWSTYKKAYEDIERSGLSPNYLVSVDHSLDSMPGPSMPGPSMPGLSMPVPSPTVPSMGPIPTGDIDSLVKQTSVSTTKSIVSDSSSTSTSSTSQSSTTSTTCTSTVIIQKSSEYPSLYELGQCDLFNGIQILKGLDKQTVNRALSGKYYMTEATPCSFYDSPDSRVGILNTCFPACRMQTVFDAPSDDWDCTTPRMVMDRGYNMRTGELQMTRSYISAVYSDDHPFGYSTWAIDSEGYYPESVNEEDCLPLDGMICKPRTDMYKHRIITSILGYKDDEYLILGVANRYKNPLFSSEQVNQVICYTRQRIPSLETMKSLTQELLRCGYNPNHLIKIDQTMDIDDDYVFDTSYYESQTSCWSSSSSSCSSSMSSTTISSSSKSSSMSISC